MFLKLRGGASPEGGAPIPLEEALSRPPLRSSRQQQPRHNAPSPSDYPFSSPRQHDGSGNSSFLTTSADQRGGQQQLHHQSRRYDPSLLLARGAEAAAAGREQWPTSSVSPASSAVRRPSRNGAEAPPRSVSFLLADDEPSPSHEPNQTGVVATTSTATAMNASPAAHDSRGGGGGYSYDNGSARALVQRPMPIARRRSGSRAVSGAASQSSTHDFVASPCGLFVSQATILAAFSTSEMVAAVARARQQQQQQHRRPTHSTNDDSDDDDDGGEGAIQPGLVVSVECGGWLRMRDLVPSSNDGSKGMSTTGPSSLSSMSLAKEEEGMVRYQCRLTRGHEATCACWTVTAAEGAERRARQRQLVRCLLIVGLLGGGLACYRVSGESLMEMQSVPWATVPVVQVCALSAARMAGGSYIVSTSTLGDLAVWSVEACGLTCIAQTTTCGETGADSVFTVCDAGRGGSAPMSADCDWSFFANAVPAGYEEELVGDSTCAVLVEGSRAAAVADGGGGDWHVRTVLVAPAAEGPIHALCAAPLSHQLWAGTGTGSLLVWDTNSCALLRRIGLPAPSPVHSLTLTGAPSFGLPVGGGGSYFLAPLPDAVWACQMNGDVTAWESNAFALLQQLTVSYPPLPHKKASSSAREDKRRKATNGVSGAAGGGDGAAAVVVVEDAVDLTRALCHDGSGGVGGGSEREAVRRRGHFTVGVMPLEPVVMWRTWSTATDGTVRSWLVPATTTTSTTAAAATHGPLREGDSGGLDALAAAAAASPPLDPEVVRAFLHARAEEVAAAQADAAAARAAHMAEVQELQERNETLAAALKEATAQLQQQAAAAEANARQEAESARLSAVQTPPPPPRDRDGDGHPHDDKSGSGSVWGQAPVTRRPNDFAAPPPLPSPTSGATASSAESLSQLLQSLRGKLDASMEEKEAIQHELLAYRLRNLDECAATHDARVSRSDVGQRHRHQRRSSPSPSPSSSSSSATASCSSEDIALVEAWSSTPLPILGGGNQAPHPFTPVRRPETNGHRDSSLSSPSALRNGSTILAPAQSLYSPY